MLPEVLRLPRGEVNFSGRFAQCARHSQFRSIKGFQKNRQESNSRLRKLVGLMIEIFFFKGDYVRL